MRKGNEAGGKVSRRHFFGTAAVAVSMVPLHRVAKASPIYATAEKPNSKIGGVQVGAITYSWRSMPGKPEDIIRYCAMAGIDSLELMGNVAEEYAGIPGGPPRPPRGTE